MIIALSMEKFSEFLVRVKEQLENPEQLIFGADPIKLLLDI